MLLHLGIRDIIPLWQLWPKQPNIADRKTPPFILPAAWMRDMYCHALTTYQHGQCQERLILERSKEDYIQLFEMGLSYRAADEWKECEFSMSQFSDATADSSTIRNKIGVWRLWVKHRRKKGGAYFPPTYTTVAAFIPTLLEYVRERSRNAWLPAQPLKAFAGAFNSILKVNALPVLASEISILVKEVGCLAVQDRRAKGYQPPLPPITIKVGYLLDALRFLCTMANQHGDTFSGFLPTRRAQAHLLLAFMMITQMQTNMRFTELSEVKLEDLEITPSGAQKEILLTQCVNKGSRLTKNFRGSVIQLVHIDEPFSPITLLRKLKYDYSLTRGTICRKLIWKRNGQKKTDFALIGLDISLGEPTKMSSRNYGNALKYALTGARAPAEVIRACGAGAIRPAMTSAIANKEPTLGPAFLHGRWRNTSTMKHYVRPDIERKARILNSALGLTMNESLEAQRAPRRGESNETSKEQVPRSRRTQDLHMENDAHAPRIQQIFPPPLYTIEEEPGDQPMSNPMRNQSLTDHCTLREADSYVLASAEESESDYEWITPGGVRVSEGDGWITSECTRVKKHQKEYNDSNEEPEEESEEDVESVEGSEVEWAHVAPDTDALIHSCELPQLETTSIADCDTESHKPTIDDPTSENDRLQERALKCSTPHPPSPSSSEASAYAVNMRYILESSPETTPKEMKDSSIRLTPKRQVRAPIKLRNRVVSFL